LDLQDMGKAQNVDELCPPRLNKPGQQINLKDLLVLCLLVFRFQFKSMNYYIGYFIITLCLA